MDDHVVIGPDDPEMVAARELVKNLIESRLLVPGDSPEAITLLNLAFTDHQVDVKLLAHALLRMELIVGALLASRGKMSEQTPLEVWRAVEEAVDNVT